MAQVKKTLIAWAVLPLTLLAAACTQAPETAAPTQMMTLDPQIVANMTQLPQATPLAGAAAEVIHDLEVMVENCPEYSPQRRSQMQQHIDWILNPAAIPQDLIMAFGPTPANRLLFGMGTFTEIEWRQAGRPENSCLLPIGRRINTLLVEAGEEPIEIFIQ